MPTPTSRRFRISDAMILVASLGLGLAMTRWLGTERYLLPFLPAEDLPPGEPLPPKLWDRWAITTLLHRHYLLSPVGATLTLAVLVLRALPPRPPWTRLPRQPGLVASLAATAGLAIAALLLVVESTLARFHDEPHPRLTFAIGTAVIASWVNLAASRRWRPEPTWIDRAGRLMGLYWIVPVPLQILQLLTFR